MKPNRWLQMDGAESPKLRLFCFPFAGGGASVYRHWAGVMPEGVQLCRIQMPGRESRVRELPFSRMEPLLHALMQNLGPYLDRPFAFFGHSMGAMVAFELAQRLKRDYGEPQMVWVSACRAPHIPDRLPIHQLPKKAFYQALLARGGIHPALLDSDDYMEMAEPLLRADLAAIETWQTPKPLPLSCPMKIWGGEGDPLIPPRGLSDWQLCSELSHTPECFPGDHFYLNEPGNEVPGRVAQDLALWLKCQKNNHNFKPLVCNINNGETDHVN